MRTRQVCLAVLLMVSSGPAAAQFQGGQDSPDEVGESFDTDMVWGRPAGDVSRWVAGWDAGFGTATLAPAAAHRGSAGLRIQPVVPRLLPDGGPITGVARGPIMQFGTEPGSLASPDAGLYFRTWMRVNTYPTPGVSPIFFNFFAEPGQGLAPTDGGWRVRIITSTPLPSPEVVFRPLTWHLVEFEYVRFALSDGGVRGGNVRTWLDGTLHTLQSNVDLRTMGGARAGYNLGIVEHFGGDLDGSIDFDDFRRSRRAPASTLSAERMQVAPSPDCPNVRHIRVQLQSSQGTAAPAPYRVALELDGGPALTVGTLVSGCLQAGAIAIPFSEDQVVVAVEGSGLLSVAATDFLPTSVMVFPNAGTDGGTPGGTVVAPLFACGYTGEPVAALALLLLALALGRRQW
jgi:hypothetical protein